MKKRLLILNGSFCEITLIKEAKKLGYYVITTGNMPDLIGHSYADEYICADYSDKEKILEIVKEKEIDRIVSCANDFGVLTACYVAEKMGWPGHDSYETAVTLHHKDKFKEFTYENDIPSPRSYSFKDKDLALEHIKNVEYPIIVKANDLTGGKGILKAENLEEAKIAVDNAFFKSRDKNIVIEPYIEGTQHTIVTFLVNKKIVAYSSCNCYSPINPYLIQTEILPADDIDELKDELFGIIEKIATKLNLADGILALQYIKKNGKPYIIETMRRCFGNQFLTVVGMESGFPWEEATVRAETGMDCSGLKCGVPKAKYCGHHGIMATRNGIVKGYSIDPSIEKHIFQKIEMIKPGERLNDYMNERIAYIWYTYEDRDEMIQAAKSFNELIKIEFMD